MLKRFAFIGAPVIVLLLCAAAAAAEQPAPLQAASDISSTFERAFQEIEPAPIPPCLGRTQAARALAVQAPVQLAKPKITREPSFWFAVATAGTDLGLSIAVINAGRVVDGKRVVEGNPLIRTADKKVSIPRALIAKGVQTFLLERLFRWKPSWGRNMMWAATVYQGLGTARIIQLGFKYRW